MPVIKAELINGAASIANQTPDYFLMIFSLAVILLYSIYIYFFWAKRGILETLIEGEVKNNMNAYFYKRLCDIDYSLFNSPKIYEDINFVQNNIPGYASDFFASQMLMSLLGTAVSIFITMFFLIKINIFVALIVLTGNIAGIFQKLYEAKNNYYVTARQMPERRWSGTYSSVMTERKYLKEIRFFGLIPYLLDKWESINKKLNRENTKISVKYIITDIIKYFISNAFNVAALILTAYLILEGKTDIGSLILVYGTSSTMLDTSGSLFYSLGQLKQVSNYTDKWREFEQYSIFEHGEYLGETPKEINIKFENVCFKYDGMQSNVLENFNAEIKNGEKIAIVGENGSGKTTFVSLLNALYHPQSGKIFISDSDISENIGLLRKYSSTLFQDFPQYEFSIRTNINIGDIYRDISENELTEAAKKAGIYDYINTLSKQFDTPIGTLDDDGINLSGGQWQKLALARAAVKKDAKIIILDEPASALDAIAESEMYENAFKLFDGKTVIIISHRLSATAFVDRILVFKDGIVIEEGSHKDLLERKGVYYSMYAAQASLYK
ncbi:MAG: ABC transporter ATP-binding protein/permease [Oscillospiraceae bacterium]|nr:ABC transporter ATP-binding protein/permease [Oscillospiraceae bacterium]